MTPEMFEKVKMVARVRVEGRGEDATVEAMVAELGVITVPIDEAAIEDAVEAQEEADDDAHEAVLETELVKVRAKKKARAKKKGRRG